MDTQPLTPEQAVIGCALISAEAHPAILALGDSDFADSRNATVAAAIRDMIRRHEPIDAITANAALSARGETARLPGGILYLHKLAADAPVPNSAMFYAGIVRQQARVRLLASLTAELGHKLAMDEAADRLGELMAWHGRQLRDIPGDLIDADPDAHLLTRLMAEPDRPSDWIVPGLLERGERVVITGHEGRGKSVLLRQIAACIAGGVHPWTGRGGNRPARVLHIDVENSRRQIRNGYRMVSRIAGGLPAGWEDNITIHVRPQGLDLPGKDAGWFHQVAAACTPDVIILGPAYKLMRGDPQRDMDVQSLLTAIDEVRVRHDAAVVIEHHSPKGDERFGPRTVLPYGSSVWMRWPEVGMGLRNHRDEMEDQKRAEEERRTGRTQRPDHLDFDEWRPAREERAWPKDIRWGPVGLLPWVPGEGYTPSTRNLEVVA